MIWLWVWLAQAPAVIILLALKVIQDWIRERQPEREATMKVFILSAPPNILGVYSSQEKLDDARAELDDAIYNICDEWIWEIDGEQVDEE